MKKLMLLTGILCFQLLATSSSAESRIYKWYDEKGNVHFSEKKPKANKSEEVSVNNKPSSDADRLIKEREERRSAELEAANSEKKPDNTKAQKTATEAQCEQARGNLKTLDGGRRIKMTNKDTGEIEYLDDAARDKQRQENKEFLSKYCP